MRRCQVFNIFTGVSVPSFAVKPGMLFLRWFVRKGSIAWVPWSISFTFVACSVHGESATFLTPAAGERHGRRFARPPCPPGIALKTAAARYAPLRLHLADRAGLDVPVSTDPLTTVMAVSPGCAPAFPPVHLSRRKQSRAEPHVNGIFHRTHAPKYENYFRANHRLPASPWSTINKKKLATLSGQHDVRRRVFCLQDRT